MGPEDTAVLGTPRRKTFAVLEQVLQLIYDTPGIIPVEIGLETNHQSRIELMFWGFKASGKTWGAVTSGIALPKPGVDPPTTPSGTSGVDSPKVFIQTEQPRFDRAPRLKIAQPWF